jgi:hypothetical protein
MSLTPREILRATRPGDARPKGPEPVNVLIALNQPRPDQACRDRLTGIGLSIKSVVDNKIVGTIPATRVDELKADPCVAEVETSVALRPHAPTPPATPDRATPRQRPDKRR